MSLAVMSVPPPGAKGTSIRTGLVGYLSDWALTGVASKLVNIELVKIKQSVRLAVRSCFILQSLYFK
jgi:hypothetical protein